MARSWSCILVKPAPTDTIIITVVASDNTNEVVVDAAATKHPRRDDEARYGLSLGSKPTEVAAEERGPTEADPNPQRAVAWRSGGPNVCRYRTAASQQNSNRP
jgi:streptogramin lyase